MEKKKLSGWDIFLIVIFVLAMIGLCLLGFKILSDLSSGNDQGQPGPVETTTPDSAAGLCLIDGKLIVGTSADYPPFETFASDFTLEGFDIALMKEIASRMGVPLLFYNIAFDGLGDALKLGQINAAISAISVTPARQEIFTFSNVYYVGSEGILAPPGSTLPPITTINQLVNQRIGVQSGSVYQTWVETNLVETGLTSPANIFAYRTIDLAINDLITGNVDLVILDAGPANKFTDQGSAVLVGQGLSQQRLAIGVRQDCQPLAEFFNTVLAQIQNDGTLAVLIQKYLNLSPDEIVPLPTPVPPTPLPPTAFPTVQPPVVVTATPPQGCIDGMQFIRDLTFPDNNMQNPPVIPPGSSFQKGWRIRNIGSCAWNNRYTLGFAGGNSPYSQMGGSTTSIIGTVQPGQTYDLYLNLVAPVVPGVYQGFWQMFNPVNVAFGERLRVGIQVPPANPATPTPAPNIPQIYRFVVNPPTIQLGQCVQISWETTGSTSGVNIFSNGNPIWVNGPSTGTIPDCPTSVGQVVYEIQANGPGGTAREDQVVTVIDNPPPTATPPPQPPPAITVFDVQPAQIEVGGCVGINWQINGTVDYIRLLRDGSIILDNAHNPGNAADCPSTPGSVVYRLEAQGAGQSTSAERAITVSEVPQPPPFIGIYWELKALSDPQIGLVGPLPGSQTTVMFKDNGGLEGSAGCNNYTGRYTAAGSSMTIQVDMTTQMLCSEPPGMMEQENRYLQLLQSVRSYQLNGSDLALLGADNNPLLIYSPAAQPRQ